MSLINELKPIVTFLFYFGLCPFTLPKSTNIPKCTSATLSYTCIMLTLCIIIGWYTSYYAYFINRTASDLFEGTQKITRMVQRVLTIFVYYAIILLSIINRQYHVNFLKRFIAIDNCLHGKFLLFKNENARRYPNLNYKLTIIILFCYFVINSLGILWRDNITISLIIFSVIFAFEIVTVMLTVIYIRNICLLIINCFRVTGVILRKLFDTNLLIKYNYQKLLELFTVIEQLLELKSNFNKLISKQLTCIATYDIVAITIASFSGCREFNHRGFKFRFFYHLVVSIVSHIVKNFLLISAMNRLGLQVLFACCWGWGCGVID